MLRFDQLIRSSMVIRDVKQRHPETREVFESFGVRETCDDCSIETAARKQGIPSREIVDALNQRIGQ